MLLVKHQNKKYSWITKKTKESQPQWDKLSMEGKLNGKQILNGSCSYIMASPMEDDLIGK